MIYYPRPLNEARRLRSFCKPSLLLKKYSMSCCVVFVVATLSSLMTLPAAQGQTYEIDNDHTSLVFAVSHSGLSYTYGRFNKCVGDITVAERSEDQSFNFTIATNSIDTNNLLRDDHLKGRDFFNAEVFPKIEFQSVEMTSEEDVYTAKGVLKMRGVEKDFSMKLTKIGIGAGPRGDSRIGFFSKFTIQRSDFGIKTLPKIIGDQIAITLSFEGVLKPKPKSEDEKMEQAPVNTADAKERSDDSSELTDEVMPDAGFGILDN